MSSTTTNCVTQRSASANHFVLSDVGMRLLLSL
jgi:hypothetical protein